MSQSSRLAVLALVSSALLAGCNDASLIGAPVEEPEIQPCAVGSAVSNQGPMTRRARPTTGSYRPAANGVTASAMVSVDALLAAMDVNPGDAIAPTLTGHMSQSAAFSSLGSISPTEGSTMAWLSTGVAGAGTPSSVDPNALDTQIGTDFSGAGCGTGGAESNDCVQLSFGFVVPDDMQSIRFDFNFLSTEYPEFVNQGYNDEFKVSMSSPSHNYDNLVFDENARPINIDSAFMDETCADIAGTGFDVGYDGYCDAGATGLLTTIAPVEPGETVILTFTLMDRGDGIYDTAVMIDNVQVSTNPVETPETGC